METKNKLNKKGLVVAMLIILMLIFLRGSKNANDIKPDNLNVTPVPTTIVKRYSYDILSKIENKTVENVSLLTRSGEANLKEIASEVRISCKKPCNISIYDDKKAYELQKTYNDLYGDMSTEPLQLEKWNKENYVYVADHLVGYSEFSSGSFSSYPFKDGQYDDLKAKK